MSNYFEQLKNLESSVYTSSIYIASRKVIMDFIKDMTGNDDINELPMAIFKYNTSNPCMNIKGFIDVIRLGLNANEQYKLIDKHFDKSLKREINCETITSFCETVNVFTKEHMGPNIVLLTSDLKIIHKDIGEVLHKDDLGNYTCVGEKFIDLVSEIDYMITHICNIFYIKKPWRVSVAIQSLAISTTCISAPIIDYDIVNSDNADYKAIESLDISTLYPSHDDSGDKKDE